MELSSLIGRFVALVLLYKYPKIILYLIFIWYLMCLQLAGILKYFDTNKFITYLLLVIFRTSFAYLSSESNQLCFLLL